MIAWKPMVVYGGPNYLHRPWGQPKPRPWGKPYPGPWGKPQKTLLGDILKKNNPVAWGPPQPKNIDTSAFDAPDMSDYLDDYEQGNLLKHTAGLDTIFVQIYMDAPPGVPGVSKNQIHFFKNKTVEFLR